uniref:Annexin A9 n=1 Tax=Oryctolagus cuniculus TaxID=9986 RepID=G1T8F2_RABIT
MSASSGKPAPTLTQEILSHLGLASKTAAWGTLGVLRTFLSFSVDKDVQRLLRAIAGQGEPRPSALGEPANGRRMRTPLREEQGLTASLPLTAPEGGLGRGFLEPALSASGSAKEVATEILATRAPARLQECLAVYKRDFQVEAEEDIKSETSGTLRDLLLALAKGGRESYSGVIDYNLAEQDAQALQQDQGPHSEGTWVRIFTQRNPEHLIRVFEQYHQGTGQGLEDAVRSRFHGDTQVALLSLASVVRNTPLYFAEKLHQALQEAEPNYQALTRILISRSETDLLSIRAEFKKKFGKSLYSSLQDAVKGDCRPALLALCRAEDM